MSGMRDYLNKKENSINKIIEKNDNLKGFAYYLNGSSEDTIYNYLLKVNNFLTEVNKEPEDLSFDDFLTFINNSKRKKDGTPSGQSYRVITYQSLKKYGNYLVAKKALKENPMLSIPRPTKKESQVTIEKRERGYLNEEEVKIYLNNVITGIGNERSIAKQNNWKERDLALVLIFLTTGIRCSALYRIDISDIDLDKKTLTVTDKESKVTTYALSDYTFNSVKDWISKREKIMGQCIHLTNALFISNRMARLSNSAIIALVKKYAQNIAGKEISPHKLRATYGTALYNATKDIYFVQQCMNHSSPQTTEKYIRGLKGQSGQAANIIESLLK